ncbi:MAG: homoserine O-acetyltransferase [Thermoanaerobaculia bacterium]|jgi:homoserine O-acetyltransferase
MSPHSRIGSTFISRPPKYLELPTGFGFEHGQAIRPFTICYETFGELNADRSNAILVCHALSASAHAAGKVSAEDEKPGWWDGMIGYGKAFDLERDFVICVNLVGSCWGTTAPATLNPETGRPYGSQYPWVTITDMVRAQRLVIDHLGIEKLRCVAGGSLGAMQVFMWASLFPDTVESIVAMAGAAAVPVEGVAWHIIGRKIIESDFHFHGGDYYDNPEALRGLQVARMVGHMTYLSQEALERKFGRRRRRGSSQFEIDSYLEYQGSKFSKSYDANSYVRIQAAMDEMDIEEIFGSLEKAFARYRGKALLISFDSDWLFPPPEVEKVDAALKTNGVDSTYMEIVTGNGHDAFLVDFHLITPPVRAFLARLGGAAGR